MMDIIPYSFSFRLAGIISRFVTGVLLLISIVFSAVALEGSITLPVAHADRGKANFSLRPVFYNPSQLLTRSYFIFDTKPGRAIQSYVLVRNSGTAMGTVRLHVVDATTAQTSGAVYLNNDAPQKEVGAWVTLGRELLTLYPGQSQIVPFRLSIPKKVRPGTHLGGIATEDMAQISDSLAKHTNAPQVHIKTRTVVAIQVNLPGTPIEQMVGTGIQAGGRNGYQQLLVKLSNIGTVMLKPTGILQISDSQNHVLKKISLTLDTFLPQTSINYPVGIAGKALGPDNYYATLTLTYHHHPVMHYTTAFSITRPQVIRAFSAPDTKTQAPPGLFDNSSFLLSPWALGSGGFLLLALLVIVGYIFYRMGRNRRN